MMSNPDHAPASLRATYTRRAHRLIASRFPSHLQEQADVATALLLTTWWRRIVLEGAEDRAALQAEAEAVERMAGYRQAKALRANLDAQVLRMFEAIHAARQAQGGVRILGCLLLCSSSIARGVPEPQHASACMNASTSPNPFALASPRKSTRRSSRSSTNSTRRAAATRAATLAAAAAAPTPRRWPTTGGRPGAHAPGGSRGEAGRTSSRS